MPSSHLTFVSEDFNNSEYIDTSQYLAIKYIVNKQKINKETQTLKDTMDQLDLMDIYRMFHPKTIKFTFFSTFSRIDHILGHKSSLGKFKKIEIIPVIFSDHSAVRLDQ